MTRALVISFTDLGHDARVDRQIEMLASTYEVVGAGTGPSAQPGVEFVDLAMPPRSPAGRAAGLARLLARRHDAVYWTHPHNREALRRLSVVRPDVVVANDLSALPLALALPGSPPVVFDAHEFAPAEQAESLPWRLVMAPYLRTLLRRYLPQVAAMMTVSPGVAQAYADEFGVESVLVTNAPRHDPSLAPTPVGEPIRLLHHGIAQRARRLEAQLEVFALLEPRFTLDLVLAEGSPGYRDELAARAADMPGVRVLEGRPMRELVAAANDYDVGLYLLGEANANHRAALPNKLFEFIQARLAVAIGPSPDMARVVREHGCGIVARDFSPASLAAELNALSAAEIAALKARSHAAASALSFEANRQIVLDLVASVLR